MCIQAGSGMAVFLSDGGGWVSWCRGRSRRRIYGRRVGCRRVAWVGRSRSSVGSLGGAACGFGCGCCLSCGFRVGEALLGEGPGCVGVVADGAHRWPPGARRGSASCGWGRGAGVGKRCGRSVPGRSCVGVGPGWGVLVDCGTGHLLVRSGGGWPRQRCNSAGADLLVHGTGARPRSTNLNPGLWCAQPRV